MKHKYLSSGFTIVEIVVVIVIIGILTGLVVLSYNGIQGRAKDEQAKALLQEAADKIKVKLAYDKQLPTAAELTNGGPVAVQISGNVFTQTFCITAVGDEATTYSTSEKGTIIEEPCDGHAGGAEYCPEESYVTLNGYFCNGATGSLATLHSGATKLLASDAQVPSGAPGYYVGRQTSRDNVGTTFGAAGGEVFCTSGWARTVSSTVNHRIGVQFIGSYGNSWLGAVTTPAQGTAGWHKASGCFTAPANTTSARLWTQNDGDATTASPAWFQTAIKLWKQ